MGNETVAQTTADHAPTPWDVRNNGVVIVSVPLDVVRMSLRDDGTEHESHSGMVAIVYEYLSTGPEAHHYPDNARFIVRAVNAHADLLAALERAADTFADFAKVSRMLGRETVAQAAEIAETDARAVIAKARGEGG